ncbi:MAG: hypothetical protein WDZ63_07420 [Burkholderiales bacterium]
MQPVPQIPPNLISLHGEEERIRALSLAAISANAEQSEHLVMIYEAMQIVHAFTHDLHHRTEDELTLQLLGIRIFNTASGALKLGLSGYYQLAFHVARDLLELTNLLDLFKDHPDKIGHWRSCTPKERKKHYEPRAVREHLKKRDGLDRDKIYRMFSQYATHATYPGFRLIAPRGNGNVGPFYDEKLLTAFVGELVKRLGFCALVYSTHFEDVSVPFFMHKGDYLGKLDRWRQTYLATSTSPKSGAAEAQD